MSDLKNILYYIGMVMSIFFHICFWMEFKDKIPLPDKNCGDENQFKCQSITGAFITSIVLSGLSAFAILYNLGFVTNDICNTERKKRFYSPRTCCESWNVTGFHIIAIVLVTAAAIATTIGNDVYLQDWAENVCIRHQMDQNCITDFQIYNDNENCAIECNWITNEAKEEHYSTIFYKDDCDPRNSTKCVPMFEVRNIGTKKATVIDNLEYAIIYIWTAAGAALITVMRICK